MSYELSSRNVEITINFKNGGPVQLKDFADDIDPLTIDDLNLGEVKFDMNRKLFRAGRLEPITCHIGLIPGSKEDLDMQDIIIPDLPLFQNRDMVTQMTVNYKINMKSVTFVTGFFNGVSMGLAATSQGRIRSKNYSFSFRECKFTAPSKDG